MLQTRNEHGLTDEQVRALHAQVCISVLSRFANDMEVDASETKSLSRLFDCLSKAGWAPGERVP